jgi:hypothetical protein
MMTSGLGAQTERMPSDLFSTSNTPDASSGENPAAPDQGFAQLFRAMSQNSPDSPAPGSPPALVVTEQCVAADLALNVPQPGSASSQTTVEPSSPNGTPGLLTILESLPVPGATPVKTAAVSCQTGFLAQANTVVPQAPPQVDPLTVPQAQPRSALKPKESTNPTAADSMPQKSASSQVINPVIPNPTPQADLPSAGNTVSDLGATVPRGKIFPVVGGAKGKVGSLVAGNPITRGVTAKNITFTKSSDSEPTGKGSVATTDETHHQTTAAAASTQSDLDLAAIAASPLLAASCVNVPAENAAPFPPVLPAIDRQNPAPNASATEKLSSGLHEVAPFTPGPITLAPGSVMIGSLGSSRAHTLAAESISPHSVSTAVTRSQSAEVITSPLKPGPAGSVPQIPTLPLAANSAALSEQPVHQENVGLTVSDAVAPAAVQVAKPSAELHRTNAWQTPGPELFPRQIECDARLVDLGNSGLVLADQPPVLLSSARHAAGSIVPHQAPAKGSELAAPSANTTPPVATATPLSQGAEQTPPVAVQSSPGVAATDIALTDSLDLQPAKPEAKNAGVRTFSEPVNRLAAGVEAKPTSESAEPGPGQLAVETTDTSTGLPAPSRVAESSAPIPRAEGTSEPLTDRPNNSPTRTESSALAGGTNDAKPMKAMHRVTEQNEIADSAQQKLPRFDASEPRIAEHAASSDHGTVQSRHNASEATVILDMTQRSPGAQPVIPVVEKIVSGPSETVHAVENLQRLINEHALELKHLGPTALVVTVKPDGKTDLVLHLEMNASGIQVQVQCRPELADQLAPKWEQLQQSMAGQGIHVAALNENSARMGSGGSQNWESSTNFRHEQPAPDSRHERPTPRQEPTLSSLAEVSPRKPSNTTVRKNGRWETWA